MALRQIVLADNANADIVASESGKVRAMAGIMLIIVNNARWVAPSDKLSDADLRKVLAEIATKSMPLTTWEAYAKGCDVVATKMANALSGEAVIFGEDDEIDFDGLRDGSEVDAVTGMVRILAAYGATTGGQIRDWAKQDGFLPYDANRVKREREEKAAAKRAALLAPKVNLFSATVGRDSASLPDEVSTAPNQDLVTPTGIAGILAALAALTGAERLEAMAGLNAMLEADAAHVAKMDGVEPVEPPMLPDHVEDEVTTPNKARRQRAVKAAKLAA